MYDSSIGNLPTSVQSIINGVQVQAIRMAPILPTGDGDDDENVAWRMHFHSLLIPFVSSRRLWGGLDKAKVTREKLTYTNVIAYNQYQSIVYKTFITKKNCKSQNALDCYNIFVFTI